MKYINYEECDIYAMLNRTREVSKDPYKLFVASVLSGLLELDDAKTPIGMELPAKDVEDLIAECKEDFLSAIEYDSKIEIQGSSYTIRNASAVSKQKLDQVFSFPVSNDMAQITLSGIFDVTKEEADFTQRNDENKDNISYFQKIIWLAEATEDGYDKLTDMEVAVYCWALFHRKHLNTPVGACLFDYYYDKFKECFLISKAEVMSCLIDGLRFPQRYYSFSAKKVRAWNKKSRQVSIVDSTDKDAASDYWYYKATTNKFLLDD